jgi:aminopeptidase-like protein
MQEEAIKLISTYMLRLFPICRSLTGKGNRQSLQILSELAELRIQEIPCGEVVFDWRVPEEWNIVDAWIKDRAGRKLVDFQQCNLHVVSYSPPIRGIFPFEELRRHLYTLPAHPRAVPYRTSYYQRDWGFCMTHEEFEKLDRAGEYEVCIDSSLDSQGSLTVADCVHRGASNREILISTYCCHPSLANDNLSGLVLAVLLFRYIAQRETRHTYRLVVVPETIGAIAYLARFQREFRNVVGGTVITTVGGPGRLGMKSSFDRNSPIERAARKAIGEFEPNWIEYPFVPDGSDERQYSSPGFRIPTVTICKDKYYEYPEYHTSNDNLSFVRPENVFKTLQVYLRWFEYLEMNAVFRRNESHCEFQLGRRGLFPNIGGSINQQASLLADETRMTKEYSLDGVDRVSGQDLEAISWIMFGCDGNTDLLSIAERSGLDLPILYKVARKLERHDLLTQLP